MPVLPQLIQQPSSPNPSTLPIRQHKFRTPTLRLQLNDLSHDGSAIFLSNIKASEDFETQVQNVLNLLYTPSCHRPGTRSVTLILRGMDGVAYTTGTELDSDHKEIHFNLNYINRSRADQRHELLGVLCHELVHCFQWDAGGSCSGGLIEGIADWVRLRAGLGATHWKQEAEGEWDGGYQHTGYFLEYLEQRFGPGTVRAINGCLREGKYDEKKLFEKCCEGQNVGKLWKEYRKSLEKKNGSDDDCEEGKESADDCEEKKDDGWESAGTGSSNRDQK
ncbi:unnamed protein product [Zymoseptoria tritici ST99CH_3D7]|uniref:Uncharacterized protein n=1 Tax=Zymoseptoria tritici (strain ST99CH_3D7) TaxID=1276538 RepID=A0A1X7S4Y3_ZYMT9|nr:unnamed protein product [Zymoseptoria tritici ST99CH_3D7]